MRQCGLVPSGAVLEAYCRRAFPRVKTSGDFVYVACVACGKPDKLWAKVRHIDRPWWYCFRCQATGDAARLVMLHRSCTRFDALVLLRDLDTEALIEHPSDCRPGHVPSHLLPRGGPGEAEERGAAMAPASALRRQSCMPESYRPIRTIVQGTALGLFERLARQYLCRRGVSLTQIVQYRIGYAEHGNYAGRVIIPVTRDGQDVYFVARAFLPLVGGKYLNPPRDVVGIGKRDVLFNLDRARLAPRVILTEGVFDAIAVGWHGIAILGKSLSETQLALLYPLRTTTIVDVMLDADARRERDRLVTSLQTLGFESRPMLVAGDDPAAGGGRGAVEVPSFVDMIRTRLDA